MTNADVFKSIFGLYATEVWAKPESEFLEWLNAEVSVKAQEPCEDAVSREAAIAEVMWFPQCHTDTIHWTRMKARLERLPTVTPKAQEPVEPFVEYSVHTGSKWICCGACEKPMVRAKDEIRPKFCSECGQAVKWE